MAIPGTVPVGGTMAPTSETDTFAVTDSKYNKDGLRNVTSILERNNITNNRRVAGMLVGVTASGATTYYKLLDVVWNGNDSDWELLTFGDVSGAQVKTFNKTSNGTETIFSVTHNLGKKSHIIQVYHESDMEMYTQNERGLNTDFVTVNSPLPDGESFTILILG